MTNSMVSPRSATLCGFHPQPQGPGARSRCRTAPASRLPPVVRRISTIIASQSCPRHVRSPPGYTPSRTPDTPGRPPAGPARRRPRCRRAAGSSSPEPRCTDTAAVSPRRREFITRTPVHGHGHDLATPPGVHHQNPDARTRPRSRHTAGSSSPEPRCAARPWPTPAPAWASSGPACRPAPAPAYGTGQTPNAGRRSPVAGRARRRSPPTGPGCPSEWPGCGGTRAAPSHAPSPRRPGDPTSRNISTARSSGRLLRSRPQSSSWRRAAAPPPRQAGGRPDDRTCAHAGESGREAALPRGLLIRVGNTTWVTPQRDRSTRGDPVPRFPASRADGAAGELSVLGALAPDASTDSRR